MPQVCPDALILTARGEEQGRVCVCLCVVFEVLPLYILYISGEKCDHHNYVLG